MPSRSDLQEQLEATDRKLGTESLFHFAKFCLGYKGMQLAPHGDVCRYAEGIVRKYRRGLDLEPRGSFKTTVFSQALPLWIGINNPDVRILLDSQVLQNSNDNLGVIKRHIQDPHFQHLFGDLESDHWTIDEITFSTRKRRDLKEPSIRCASPERVQVGPHYDVILADDLVGSENSKNPEQRRFIKDHFKLLFSLLEPDGVILAIGTRWHYEDLYSMILEEFPEFVHRIKSAVTGGRDGGLYFPQRLTKEFLDDQVRRLGRDFFNSQYLNDPAPEDEHSKFQKTWFKGFQRLPHQRYGFIAIDPGGSKKGSDEWAMMSGYTDPDNNLYFDELRRGNWRLDQAWDILFALIDHVKPISVGLEVTGAQKYLLEALQAEMRRRNKFVHVVPLSHAMDSKEFRILKLQPRYQCGAVFHSAQMGPLEDQLRRFPRGKDDVADVAAMIDEIAVPPRKSKPKAEMPKSIDDIVWQSMRSSRDSRYVHPALGSQV